MCSWTGMDDDKNLENVHRNDYFKPMTTTTPSCTWPINLINNSISNVSSNNNCPSNLNRTMKEPPFSFYKTVLNFWKYLKEFSLSEISENVRQSCVCSEATLCRTPFPVYIVLARTMLLRFLIRPLYKFLGRSKGKSCVYLFIYFCMRDRDRNCCGRASEIFSHHVIFIWESTKKNQTAGLYSPS